jgi:integrase
MDKQFGLKRGGINQKLRTVFAFYVWAEETGRLLAVVDLSGARFAKLPISTKAGPDGARSSPLVFKTVEEPNRHTPTDEEIDRLHVVLSGRHAVRDGLILAWAEQTALRRAEILSLLVEQVPSSSVIQDLYDREETYSTVVKVKGGRRCAVHILPSLLEQTRDYIEFERADTLARARSRLPQMRDCGALFLSETGLPPKPNSISKQTSKFFKRAGIKNASLHRLRAVHLTRLAERYVDLVDDQGLPLSTETIALKIQEAARWVGTSSLHRYIEAARSRRVNTASLR